MRHLVGLAILGVWCVLMLVVSAVGRRAKPLKGAVVLSLLVIGASSSFVFLVAYSQFIYGWGWFLVLPVAVVGIPVGVVFLVFVTRRGWISWPTLCLAPLFWWGVWVYLERPGGIWVETHRKTAESFLFVPVDAYNVRRDGPRPHGGATFSVSFYTGMRLEDLTAYYTNMVRQAGLTLVDYREVGDGKPGEYYHPMRELYYRSRDGVLGCARLCANPPYHAEERWVDVQCFFPVGPLNPRDAPL